MARHLLTILFARNKLLALLHTLGLKTDHFLGIQISRKAPSCMMFGKKYFGLKGFQLNMAIATIAGLDFLLFGYDQGM